MSAWTRCGALKRSNREIALARSVFHTKAPSCDGTIIEYHVVEALDDKQKLAGYGIVRRRVVLNKQIEYVPLLRLPAGAAPSIALAEAHRRVRVLAEITTVTTEAILRAKARLDAAKKVRETTGNAEPPANTSIEAVPI